MFIPDKLTDSSAGTAALTIAAMADPTDGPGSADILRDDLVAVHWPIIRNNFATLNAQVNLLRAAIIELAQSR